MSILENESKIEEANKELVRGFMRTVFDNHRPDLAVNFFAPQGKWHGGNFGTVEGSQNIAGLLSAIVGGLPDIKATEQDIVAKDDTVVVRLVVEGTHKGNLLGFPPTNRRVQWDAIDLYKIANGKITDDYASEDGVKILADIGAYTPPWIKSGT
jgi:predicted ester cyclase